jgi:hypothetical protein
MLITLQVSLRLSHASCGAQIPSAPIRLDPRVIIPNHSFPGNNKILILVRGEQLQPTALNASQILDQPERLPLSRLC